MHPALSNFRRLVHHAICVGATGSGKTGLGTGLLEEIALARVPVLAVDPKGDLPNLRLVFPDLTPAAFAAWSERPAEDAHTWREGLRTRGLGPDDLQHWRDAVDVRILTPGSDLAPVDVLGPLLTPPADHATLAEHVTGCVSSLFALIGETADVHTDPTAVVLARLLTDAFAAGQALPLDALIPALCDPPFDQIQWFPLDTFLPRPARLDLARKLNAVAASPGFAAWQHGTPLDLNTWLQPAARTPLTVLSLPHLSDASRSFFLTTLLHQLIAWMRRQPGTPGLRAVLYLDEASGLLPPHPHDPPTKGPLLTLIKQARAVGLGVIVATQNPVDLDYKAIGNAGTWWVGRLRTRQDRARVLQGLAEAHDTTDLDAQIATLQRRQFLVIDDDGPRTITAPFPRAFLRGPLTRPELARLLGPPPAVPVADGLLPHPPPVPHDVPVRWLHPDAAADTLGTTPAEPSAPRWQPALYARFHLRFDDGPAVIEERIVHHLLRHPPAAGVGLHDLPEPDEVALPDDALHRERLPGGRYDPLPAWLADRAQVAALIQRWKAALTLNTSGPDEAPHLESNDVRPLGLVLVWLPT